MGCDFYPVLVREGGSGKPSETDGSPGRLRGSAPSRSGRRWLWPPARPSQPRATRAGKPAASPSGAYYQQLLLLSPPRISLPQPTASLGAPSPPTPPFPSPPPPLPPPSTPTPQPPGQPTPQRRRALRFQALGCGSWGRAREERARRTLRL